MPQAVLPSGEGRRGSRARPWCVAFRWAALGLCVLWGLSGAVMASERPAPSTPLLPAPPASWDQGDAVADLDGDGRPDLAFVRAEGRSTKGFSYRVELTLSTRPAQSSFSLTAPEGGLHIIPRDVNGDGELDLVITSARLRAPVGVWINDSHGGFSRSDRDTFPPSIWTEAPHIFSEGPQETFQASVPQSYRSCVDFLAQSRFQVETHFECPAVFGAVPNPQRPAISRLKTRAPPPSFSQKSI